MRRAAAFALVLGLVAAATGAEKPVVSLEAGFPLAAHRVADVDGDGTDDLVLVGVGGEVRVWRRGPTGTTLVGPVGTLVLPDPMRSLLWIGRVSPGPGPVELAVLSSGGLVLHPWGGAAGFAPEGQRVARGAAFRLRVGEPAFAEILRDINGDGRPDLIVPGAGDGKSLDSESCQIWMNEGARGPAGGAPAFRRVAVVRSILRESRVTEGRALSDRLESAFRIPELDFRDVNGDGRKDLVVVDRDRREFHLQGADGTIPSDPDVVLDLDIFRDTTAEADIRPGRVLAGGDDARLTISDLNSDGIPDYLVAHRRKIWIFMGSRDGPSFTNPKILKVAEDVSALMVLPLDDTDDRPDLLIVRIMVPSVASIVTGLLGDLEIEISAKGYAAVEGDRAFTDRPTWEGALTVVVPDVLGIIRDPGALIGKFQQTQAGFRRSIFGDFDRDGQPDVAMIAESDDRVDAWRLPPGTDTSDAGSSLGSLFFGGGDRRWDIGQALEWLSNLARERSRRLTGDREPDATFPLRDPARYALAGFYSGDVDGDGRAEIITVYRDRAEGGAGLVDIHRPGQT